jgi:hypothetical protein
MINFDATAILEEDIVGELGGGRYGITHAEQICYGTLTECLHQFQRRPDKRKKLCRILTTGNPAKYTHDRRDIELLTQANYALGGH